MSTNARPAAPWSRIAQSANVASLSRIGRCWDTVKQKGQVLACPVASILQAGTQDEQLRRAARQVLSNWTTCVAKHADRLGHASPESAAESLIIQLEGAWLLALAEQNGAPLERQADRLSERTMACSSQPHETVVDR